MTTEKFIREFGNGVIYHYKVDNEVYVSFQNCSKDQNPLHTQLDFARAKGFDKCVMYGNILNCFVSHFVGMLLPTSDVIIHSQDIKFKRPVFMDDELLFTAKIDSIYEQINTIEFSFTFKNATNNAVAKGHVQIGLI
jgi:3-hydroxybutyryl-CoA dehydratase